MSHIVEAKTQITNPTMTLLRQAVELVAGQQPGGRLANHYLSYFGKKHRVDLALVTDEVYRGIGIQVKPTGELSFIGDFYGYEELARSLQQRIVQTYVGLATMEALQALGYQASASEGENGQLILTGVTYA